VERLPAANKPSLRPQSNTVAKNVNISYRRNISYRSGAKLAHQLTELD